jgi:hypothetical protein
MTGLVRKLTIGAFGGALAVSGCTTILFGVLEPDPKKTREALRQNEVQQARLVDRPVRAMRPVVFTMWDCGTCSGLDRGYLRDRGLAVLRRAYTDASEVTDWDYTKPGTNFGFSVDAFYDGKPDANGCRPTKVRLRFYVFPSRSDLSSIIQSEAPGGCKLGDAPTMRSAVTTAMQALEAKVLLVLH